MMTRKEEVEMLKKDKEQRGECFISDAIDIAIKALKQEPCADLCKSCDTKGCIFQFGIKRGKCDFYTSKKRGMSDEQIRTVINVFTCEDAISRAYIEPLVEELENICINGDEHVLDILSNIKNAPSVTPQQPKQEPILDKIRAEIEQTVSRYSISRERGGMGQIEWSDRLIKESEVLQIIDKYKEKEK